MKTSESIGAIAKAMAAFQSEVKQPVKDGKNPHFKSNYVTLDGTVNAIHECASKHGLSYIQSLVNNESGTGVVTLIMHESGEFIEMDPFILPMDKKNAQGAGSAATYARRYSLSAAFGIVSDVDDDGNEAAAQGAQPITQKQVGELKVKVLEFAKLCEKAPGDVYEALKLKENNIPKLSTREADTLITKVENWTKQKQSEAGVGA